MREIKFRVWVKHHKEILQCVDPTHYRHDDESYALMQYTGLKDKNGVEIYEADILKTKIDFGYGPQPVTAKVIWKDAGWQFDSEAGCAYGASGGFEVIGNIYQNPELLEASK